MTESPDTERRNTEALDSSKLRRISGQLGSNPAGVFEDPNGQRYYIKTLESPQHASNEYLAACLYQLCGAPVLTYVRTNNPCEVATSWCNLDKTRIAHFSEAERTQARHWLGVHAWTANWDAAGLDGDNQGVANGIVLTLDVGGALLFRASGDPKGNAFGDTVSEFQRLQSDPDNPHAMKLFGGMSVAEQRSALQVVARLNDSDIRRVILDGSERETLAEKMIARKADLQRQLDTLPRN